MKVDDVVEVLSNLNIPGTTVRVMKTKSYTVFPVQKDLDYYLSSLGANIVKSYREVGRQGVYFNHEVSVPESAFFNLEFEDKRQTLSGFLFPPFIKYWDKADTIKYVTTMVEGK